MPMIMLPADVEKYSRHSIKSNNSHSMLPIRVAMAAAVLHGNEWFGVRDVQVGLAGTSPEATCVADVADRLEKAGLIERRIGARLDRRRHEARLRCALVDLETFHGTQSEKLRRDLETYCQTRRRATPLAVLLWLAVNLYRIHLSDEIVRFLKPDFDVGCSPTSPGRIFSAMADVLAPR